MNARLEQYALGDEIDLRKLVFSLWRRRYLIGGITTTVALLAAIYAWLATPYYEVRSVLRPTTLKELDELNSTGLYTLSEEEALQRIGAALESYGVRLAFFHGHPELFESLREEGVSLTQSFERFNREAFALVQPDPKRDKVLSPFVGIRLIYPKGVDGVAMVNGLVSFVIERERRRIVDDFAAIVANRIERVRGEIVAARAGYEIDKKLTIATLLEADRLKAVQLEDELWSLREELKQRRQYRILQLEEATSIAEQLGIEQPAIPLVFGNVDQAGQGDLTHAGSDTQRVPLYFLGAKALKAERQALLARVSDDFSEVRIAQIQQKLRLLAANRQVELLQRRENEDLFLEQLAEWKGEIARLQGLRPDLSGLQLVRRDQFAVEPLVPVKPQKGLILALGLALGSFLGLFVALLLELWRNGHGYQWLSDSRPQA